MPREYSGEEENGTASKVDAEVKGMKRNKVRIIVHSQVGKCESGHYVGQEFLFDNDLPQNFCPAAYHAIYPNLRTLQYGGNIPWEEEGTVHIACPDPFNPLVFKLVREEVSE